MESHFLQSCSDGRIVLALASSSNHIGRGHIEKEDMKSRKTEERQGGQRGKETELKIIEIHYINADNYQTIKN